MDQIGKALDKAKQEVDQLNLRNWVKPDQSELLIQPNGEQGIGFPEIRTEDANLELMAENLMLTEGKIENPILADHYRMLRTRLWHKMMPVNANRIGITSAMPKAGKSFTAINLATTIARASSDDVILIDCDIRNPSIARGLGISTPLGIVDLLAEEQSISEVVFQLAHQPNLKILPGTATPDVENRFELLTTRIENVFDQIRAFNPSATVLVDLPPISIGDEVLGLAPHLDGFLMIVRDGDTDIESLQRAIELLQEFEIFGTVLNDSSESLSHYAGYAYGA